MGLQVQTTEDAHNQDIATVITAQGEYSQVEDGDVLIYINTCTAGQTKLTCQRFPFPEKIRMRYKSSVLRASGFELFARLLDDERYQIRLHKRLRKEGEVFPEKIRFVLDLGPSEDGESRMEHLAALSLPQGIVRWYLAAKTLKEIPHGVVNGHDDVCSCWKLGGTLAGGGPQPNSIMVAKKSIWDHPLLAGIRDIPEYCEIRHAANVVRLLRAMDGKPLLLDSAPRVFTIAGLARIFEIGPSGDFSVKLAGSPRQLLLRRQDG